MEQLAIVLVVLGLTFLFVRFGRGGLTRLTQRAADPQQLQKLGDLRLSPQHSIHLIRAWDRVLVVGVHASGISILDSRPSCAPEAEDRRSISMETMR